MPTFDPAVAEVVEHADLFREPQRMMHGQYIDERAEPNALVRWATAARKTLGEGVILRGVE